LEPHESSQKAAVLPKPGYSVSEFPGHAAWIDGDWKLHRIAGKNGRVVWELYNLADDEAEESNAAEGEKQRVARMRTELESWLESVARSLNGEDYASN
jgi:arylsulfatase A-like enzyme